MARKKRLNTAAVLGAECASVSGIPEDSGSGFCTAAYVRLSVEDSGKIDGYSLQNQEDLLLSFINEHKDLHLYKMYVDNGNRLHYRKGFVTFWTKLSGSWRLFGTDFPVFQDSLYLNHRRL